MIGAVNGLHVGYAVAGSLSVGLILVGKRLDSLPVTAPMVGLLAGVTLGPHALGVVVVAPQARTGLLLEATRLLLALSLMGAALRFPARSLVPVARSVAGLVGLAMPLAAAATAALAGWILRLPVGLAALLGACLSPTDPVLASGVVSGEAAEDHLPRPLRQALTVESAANDGLALPLVLLALAPVLGEGILGGAALAAYQVAVAVVLAVPAGYGAARALVAVSRRRQVDHTSELLLTLFLAVAVLGLARLVDGDGVLAVFVAGVAYNAAIGPEKRSAQDAIDEAFNRFLVAPAFVLFGALLPLPAWVELGWAAVPFAVAVLVLRRPPAVFALRPVLGLSPLDAGFAGWFGPMGVSALFYLALSIDEGVGDPRLFAAGTLAVAASTVVHGLTAMPGRRWYRARTARAG